MLIKIDKCQELQELTQKLERGRVSLLLNICKKLMSRKLGDEFEITLSKWVSEWKPTTTNFIPSKPVFIPPHTPETEDKFKQHVPKKKVALAEVLSEKSNLVYVDFDTSSERRKKKNQAPHD